MLSVLMSVYKNDDAAYLRSSIDSILGQTTTPDELVLVKDGPLASALEETLKSYAGRSSALFKVVSTGENLGLGGALAIGLRCCTNEIVARMDSDDISVPYRFEAQTSYMRRHPEIDVLGSWISEFDTDPDRPYAIRKVATEPDRIRKSALFRNPMNHMTVMFKKSAVASAGGYQHFLWFEDYHLWARLLRKGFCLANMPEVLVKVRAGESMISKRRGLAYSKHELMLQKEFLRIGFINKEIFLFNVLSKGVSRMLPQRALSILYRTCLRSSPASAAQEKRGAA